MDCGCPCAIPSDAVAKEEVKTIGDSVTGTVRAITPNEADHRCDVETGRLSCDDRQVERCTTSVTQRLRCLPRLTPPPASTSANTAIGSSAGSSSTSSRTTPQPTRRTRCPRWHVHFTPTSASWLNEVERFFAELTEKQIRRSVQGSTAELEKAILHSIDTVNQDPKPCPMTSSRPSNSSSLEHSRPHNMPDTIRNFRIWTLQRA